MFLSSIVLAFGYTVSVGPSGFVTIAFKSLFGSAPWSIYTLPGIILIGGLSHVPTVYLYVASAMRRLPSDLEEAARTAGAGIWRVSLDVTLPMVLPALVFSAALNLLLGFETFGIPLVLGDPNGILVLTTYIYKVNTIFGAPTYQVMAAVTVFLILITLPLVFIQRRLLRHARRFAAVGGKGARTNLLRARQHRPGDRAGPDRAVASGLRLLSGRRHRAARLRRELGRGRQADGAADARELQGGLRDPEPVARHPQHDPARRGRRRDRGRLLSAGRSRRAPQPRQKRHPAGLFRADPARIARADRRPDLLLAVPVRALPDPAQERR
jgi:ABC-type molybdate transport system permease subunit